ncbi:MAG TPA: hypothetical protein VHY91_27750 [Pirellulales bacterium]|jgi:hypothetical protein|nr:hypothetical protein [Pirellulales bacterium]
MISKIGLPDARRQPTVALTPGTAAGSFKRPAFASLCPRFARAALLVAAVSGMLLVAPMSPAWARKQADNSKFIPKDEGESYVTAYLIVVVSMMMGMTAICRKSYRTIDPKRSSGD